VSHRRKRSAKPPGPTGQLSKTRGTKAIRGGTKKATNARNTRRKQRIKEDRPQKKNENITTQSPKKGKKRRITRKPAMSGQGGDVQSSVGQKHPSTKKEATS